MTTTTNSGVADTELTPLTEEGALDAFASLFQEETDASKKKPSDEEGEETSDESTSDEQDEDADASDESQDDEGSEDGDKEDKDEQPAKKYADDTDTYVKIKVGEEEHEVAVKDLKRLFGQEAALTKRSQEVADQRRVIESEQQAYGARLGALLQRATAKADQFRQIPWEQLYRNQDVPAEQIETLKQMAQQALEEEKFLQQESSTLVGAMQQHQQQEIAKQASDTVKVLGDQASPLYIDGWSKQLYGDMLKFATEQGVPAEIANRIVDAPTLKLLHMALMYSKGAQKVVTTPKTAKTPKRIVKTSSAPQQAPTGTKAKAQKAMQRLSKSGSEEDAIDAFMSRMTRPDDE